MANTLGLLPSATSLSLSRSSTLVSTPPLLSLPPELLLEVITHLPMSAFLALTQTSQMLRGFVEIHAAYLCNSLIRTHYSFEAQILNTVMGQDGWLIPSHFGIFHNPFALLLSTEEQKLTLEGPGPHYLQFLTEYARDIRTRAEMTILAPLSPSESSQTSALNEEEQLRVKMERDVSFGFVIQTYCVRPFLKRLNRSVGYVPSENSSRTRLFGEVDTELEVEKPRLQESTRESVRWYFGSQWYLEQLAERDEIPSLQTENSPTPKSKQTPIEILKRMRALIKEKLTNNQTETRNETMKFKRRLIGVRKGVVRAGEGICHKLLAATGKMMPLAICRHSFRELH
ncbi:hypothetical protein B0O99DRAFT_691348 [Bisporella sp. PMI_857]|nr:hypothetical protein B0O99DRAFT_691348 [Bisporella sp. PMI_857]